MKLRNSKRVGSWFELPNKRRQREPVNALRGLLFEPEPIWQNVQGIPYQAPVVVNDAAMEIEDQRAPIDPIVAEPMAEPMAEVMPEAVKSEPDQEVSGMISVFHLHKWCPECGYTEESYEGVWNFMDYENIEMLLGIPDGHHGPHTEN